MKNEIFSFRNLDFISGIFLRILGKILYILVNLIISIKFTKFLLS